MTTAIEQNIEKIISEAISQYDCVILPEFGAFITRYISAEINRSNNIILPPSKSITFNVHLKHNDGLVAGKVAQQLQISYEEALWHTQNFAKKVQEALNNDKRFELKHIGVLFINSAQQIQFEPQNNRTQGQYHFGLSPLILPSLIRSQNHSEEKALTREDRKVIDENQNVLVTKKTKRARRVPYLGLGILVPVVAALCYVSIKTIHQPNLDLAGIFGNLSNKEVKKNTDKVSSSTTISYNPNESKIDLMSIMDINTEDASLSASYFNLISPEKTFLIKSEKKKTLVADISLLPKTDMPIREEKEDAKIITSITKANSNSKSEKSKLELSTITEGDFSVVVGCFSESSNAQRLIEKLSSSSINALIDGKNDKGMTIVSAGKFTSKSQASQFLNVLKSKNIKAWIKHP
jgi:nucleoid DNA-binding protein